MASKNVTLTPEKLLELAEQSPIVRKAVAEMEHDREVELDRLRAAAVESLASTRARADREHPKLLAIKAKSEEAVREAEKKLYEARIASVAPIQAWLTASIENHRTVQQTEAILTDSAPDEALEFIRWTEDEFDRARHGVRTYSAGATESPYLGGKKQPSVQSNSRSTTEYLGALKAAREEVQRLIVTVAARAEIVARVDELRRSLPSVVEEVSEGRL